jgi:hypothetical protein
MYYERDEILDDGICENCAILYEFMHDEFENIISGKKRVKHGITDHINNEFPEVDDEE